ncbi:hypothetical protein [Rhizobium sp. Root708]|nr:hypothetical protein [Rhizobium sp. Root708]
MSGSIKIGIAGAIGDIAVDQADAILDMPPPMQRFALRGTPPLPYS